MKTYKHKKQYFKALLQQWKAYHDIKIDYNMMREEDWYKLIETVKQDGPKRLKNHEKE